MSAPIDGFITPPSTVIQGETDSPTIDNNKTSLQALIEIMIYRLSGVECRATGVAKNVNVTKQF